MLERGFGRVINVSSVSGRIAAANNCHYGPTKTYLIALSEALALSVKRRGVHVTALCPGFTHTDFHATAGLDDLKQSTPRFMWYSAETVVREGLQAVEKGRWFVCRVVSTAGLIRYSSLSGRAGCYCGRNKLASLSKRNCTISYSPSCRSHQ